MDKDNTSIANSQVDTNHIITYLDTIEEKIVSGEKIDSDKVIQQLIKYIQILSEREKHVEEIQRKKEAEWKEESDLLARMVNDLENERKRSEKLITGQETSLKNQETIMKNQEIIMKNQSEILSLLREMKQTQPVQKQTQQTQKQTTQKQKPTQKQTEEWIWYIGLAVFLAVIVWIVWKWR